MYMINFIIIYDDVNLFSTKKHKSLRKLRVGMNRYMGMNWSTTTTLLACRDVIYGMTPHKTGELHNRGGFHERSQT